MTTTAPPNPAQIPRYAMFRGQRCRVLEYVDHGIFRILTPQDHTYRIPRERLVFVK